MKKIIKILFLINFLAVTLISAFLYVQITVNKATVSMYSIKDHYTYVRIKAPIENKDKLFVNLEKIKDISKKNKVNILFRNYDNPISYAADNKIDFGRSEYLINDFSYNVNSKSYIQTLYKDGRIRHTDRDQKFELNEFDEIKPNMNGIFLIETKNKKIIKKIYLELENKKIPLYEKNGSTFKYPDPELKTYKIFYDFYGFIILFLLITLCLLVFSFNKSIRIYKSMGYTNTQINYSILGKYLLLTTLVALIIIYPLSKNNRLQIISMELGFLILFYILSYFVVFISTLNTNNINIATAIKKKSLQNGTSISVKLIVSFIFIMMSFPIVNNALYAFNLNIERTSNYSKKTLVFFPVHTGQFITNIINPSNQFDYVTNNILKIAESIDGEAMHVMNPRSMGPNQIIMMNENTFKKQNLRDYLGKKIEYFDTGKVRLFIPFTLRKNTDSIKKMVIDATSIPTNIEYIDDKQTLNYNGETKKYYDPVILVASSKQLYDKKYKLAMALAPNGGGKKDYMNIPGKPSYYKNIEKDWTKKD